MYAIFEWNQTQSYRLADCVGSRVWKTEKGADDFATKLKMQIHYDLVYDIVSLCRVDMTNTQVRKNGRVVLVKPCPCPNPSGAGHYDHCPCIAH